MNEVPFLVKESTRYPQYMIINIVFLENAFVEEVYLLKQDYVLLDKFVFDNWRNFIEYLEYLTINDKQRKNRV